MLAGEADAEALAALSKGREKASRKSGYQYTLAMMEAMLQQPDAAHQSLMQGLVRDDDAHLGAAAWAAYGKICKQYGWAEDAADAYTQARAAAEGKPERAARVLSLIPVK